MEQDCSDGDHLQDAALKLEAEAKPTPTDSVISVMRLMKLAKAEAKQIYLPTPSEEPFLSWQTVLKDVWISDDPKEIRRRNIEDTLSNIFGTVLDPYDVILGIYSTCFDYCIQRSNTLATYVIKYAKVWLGQCDRQSRYSKFLTLKCKNDAFKVATAKGTINLDIFVDIYQLFCDEIIEEAYHKAQEMISCNNISSAIACATQFRLQSRFKLEELVIPAVLQDRMPAVEAYLVGQKDLQCQLAAYFDELIGLQDREIRKRFDSLIERRIMTIPITRLEGKALQKLVAKIFQAFDLPSSVVPNLKRSREESRLRYIAHLHFVMGVLSEETYVDYIVHALTVQPELRSYYVGVLVKRFKNIQEALRWVVYFKMDENPPECIRDYLAEDTINYARKSLVKFLNLRETIQEPVYLFDEHPIVMIDDIDGLMKVAESVSKTEVVGIDTEWKPSFLALKDEVALIQISFDNASYLLDMIALEKVISSKQWEEFFDEVFCSENTLKLGFDFANDIRAIVSSFPSSNSFKMKNVICLMRLVKSLVQEFPDLRPSLEKIEHTNDSGNLQETGGVHFGLSDLHKMVLGQPLDKSEQFSNWAMRPLRLKQMCYAANDAYCLIKIYRALKERVTRLDSNNWELHMQKANMNYVKPKEPKKPKIKDILVEDLRGMMQRIHADDSSFDTEKLRRPKELKFIVDSMLLDLGKNLRRCGVDTLIPDSRSLLVQWAKEDPDRFILTSGKAYDQLVSNGRLRHRTVKIPSQELSSPLKKVEYVFKHFHINMKEEDIFSRCMKCNSADLLKVPPAFLEAMYHVGGNRMASGSAEEEFAKYKEKVEDGWVIQVTNEKDLLEINALSPNGRLDIVRCLAYTKENCDGVVVGVNKVPPQALERSNRDFYICGSCGKIYWDGYQKTNYSMFASPLLGD